MIFHQVISSGDEVMVQSEGGAIGSHMTGEISRISMILWDKILIAKCKSLGITVDMYDRYVDDETVVTRVLSKGWYYDMTKDRMQFSKEREIPYMESCDTERTAKIIAEIANTIQDGIQVTVDWPEANDDG